MSGKTCTIRVRLQSGWFERLRGLLGTGRRAQAVLLARCSSVHTFGMPYPIDILFLDRRSKVMRSYRRVGPGTVVKVRGAIAVIERPARPGPWPQAGEGIDIRIGFGDERRERAWLR